MYVVDPKKFAELRRARLLTRGELAAAGDVAVKTICRVEAGLPVMVSSLRKCVAGLGVTLAEAVACGVLRYEDDEAPAGRFVGSGREK